MKIYRHAVKTTVGVWLFLANAAMADESLGPPNEIASEVILPVLGPYLCAPLADGHPVGVTDAVVQAICSNPKIKRAWSSVHAQEAAVGVARAAYFPTLGGRMNAERNSNNVAYDYTEMGGTQLHGEQRSESLSSEIKLGWTLFEFGHRSARLERDRDLLSAAISSRDETLQNVFFSAAQAFYMLEEKRSALDAARRYEDIAARSEDAATAKHHAGAGNLSDELQAKTNHRRAIVERIDAEGEVKAATGKLAVVMGWEANHPLTLASDVDLTFPDFAGDSVDHVIDIAMQRRPILRTAKAKLDAQQANEEMARSERMPVLSLVGTLTDVRSHAQHWGSTPPVTRSRGNMIGVQIEIPFFDGFATRYHVAQAHAQVDEQRAEVEDVELQISLEVWGSYNEVKTCEKNLVNSAHLLSDAEAALGVAKGRYQAGVGGFTELLNAQIELAGAQRIRVRSVARLRSARLMLAKSIGRLSL